MKGQKSVFSSVYFIYFVLKIKLWLLMAEGVPCVSPVKKKKKRDLPRLTVILKQCRH